MVRYLLQRINTRKKNTCECYLVVFELILKKLSGILEKHVSSMLFMSEVTLWKNLCCFCWGFKESFFPCQLETVLLYNYNHTLGHTNIKL